MRSQAYGRMVMTTSGAGIHGNFGQANYSAAKLGLYGLAQTLAIEGARKNILVNTIAPVAASRLTAGMSPAHVAALRPAFVTPLVLYLSSDCCQVGGQIFEVGGGCVARLRWQRSRIASFDPRCGFSPDDVAASWATIQEFTGDDHPSSVADSFAPIARKWAGQINLEPTVSAE